MDHFGRVIGVLDGRFPGQFDCKPGMHGLASGLEVRCAGRPGHAFIFEPDRDARLLLALHEDDRDQGPEVWSAATADECVERILPWAFPRTWTPPEPVDRAKEKRRLGKIAAGLVARDRVGCQVGEPNPDLLPLLTAERRQALEQDVASLDPARLKRRFPWDPAGRLALKTIVLLRAYPCPGAQGGRVVSLAALGPERRRDEQAIRVELRALLPPNHPHRWHDLPWMWQRVEHPDPWGIPLRGEPGSPEQQSLALLDQGRIEDALSLYGVSLSDDLHQLLGGERISPPACCAHPDAAWTDLLVTTLRQSAPWLLGGAVPAEAERMGRYTGRKPGKRALAWKLAIFPGQTHLRKASLMLTARRDGRDPRFVIEATASNARLADTSWKRPIEVDFLRYGVPTPFAC
jgi:hypothetical protein